MSLGGQHAGNVFGMQLMADGPAVAELLARSALFGALTLAQRQALAQEMRNVALDAGEVLFARGDPGHDIYLVVDGRIRISVLSSDGRELSFAHAVPGDIFGEIAALDGSPRSADATAITAVRLKTLSGSALHRLLSTSTTAAIAIIKLLCGRLRDVSEHFEAIALHPIEVRLARLLLDTLEERETAGGVKVASLTLGITQNELALLMGSTRQRANVALMLLEKAGAIRRSGDALECHVEALHKMALRE
jgi:CRP/FNR family transcriptional regulator, cyclic AMP receptor protein